MDTGRPVSRSSMDGRQETSSGETPAPPTASSTPAPPVRMGPEPPPKDDSDTPRNMSVEPTNVIENSTMLPLPPPSSLAAPPHSQTTGTPGPSVLPGVVSLTSSVPLFSGEDRAKTPGVFGGLPPMSGGTPGPSSLLPTSPNTVPSALMNPNRYSPPRSPLPADAPVPPSPEARPLNVKDALSYLEMVKVKFQDKPDVYNHFLDIMKDFKSQAIDTPGVIERVSSLFNGHTALIQGFNTFLPHGYRIDCTIEHDHSLITVTTPSGTTTQTTGGPSRHVLSTHASPAPYPPLAALAPGPLPPLPASPYYQGGSPATIHAVAALQSGGQSLIPSATQAAAASIASASAIHPDVLAQKGAPPMVEFNQAVNYVNKIKQRFASDPDTYKQFLEILQTYQKEQRPIAEVYQQVNVLFNNQRDLLEDFQHFLPDHNNAGNASGQSVGGGTLFGMMAQIQAAEGNWGREDKSTKGKEPSASSVPLNKPGPSIADKDKRKDAKEREREKERERDRERLEKEAREREKEKGKLDAKRKKRGLEKEPEKNGKPGNNSKRTKVAHRGDMDEPPYGGSPPPAQQYHSNPNQPSTAHSLLQNPLTTPDEIAFFERVKKLHDDRSVYHEFLKMLNLFVQEIIDARTLVDRARHYLNEELLVQFKEILGWDDRAVEPDNGSGEGGPVAPPLDRPRIDLGNCPKFGPSYRRLPLTEINLACSGRDSMCWEVLNDEWVSHPTWLSEETGFTTGKKNSYEEAMHKSEEERHEYDFNIEALLRTIAILEPIKARIDAMDPDKRATFTLDPHLGGQSRGIYQRVIKKVYDKAVGAEVIRALHENPAVAVRVVLERLKQKEEEWKRAQREWNKVWREVEARNYYKSLDHQGANVKANDKKALTSKQLVLEAEARRKEGHKTRHRMVDPTFRRVEREDGTPAGMSFVVDDMGVVQDVIKLVLVYLDRSSGNVCAPDEKKRVERFLRTVVPMVFMQDHATFDAAFGEAIEGGDDLLMSDDTATDDGGRKRGAGAGGDLRKRALKNQKARPRPTRASPMAVDTPETASPDSNLPEGVWVRMDEPPAAQSSSSDGKRLKGTIYVNNAIYVLLRIIQIWYSRLVSLKKLAKTLSESEASYLENPLAVQLGLNDAVPPSAHRLIPANSKAVNPAEFYPTLLDASERMFDGEIDWQQFEEVARFMFGTKAYVVFTIDLFASRVIKQAQLILADPRWPELFSLLQKERRETAPGPSSQFLINYRRQVESLIAGEDSREKDNSNLNVHRIVWNGERKVLSFQLLARDDGSVMDSETMNGRWRQYIDSYVLTHQTEGIRGTVAGPLLRRNLRANDSTEETPKYHAEGGLHIKVDMLTYRLFFVSRTEETYCRERTSQEVRQLDEQAKKTASARTKAFDTWLASKTEDRQKQDNDVSMEL
ncbi:histone deacetylase complex, SIN3 component, putative [Rhizoctonia solani AG-3 Rhs1AP]|uniref:Histone deacetylase complex, SIN3 component, putative n=2 Tax=Rhizoctonia solani AG-3 TaxID=1086053 RepID=X8J428_9AGAM|nr:histone deacetylase complex, SIN3 component, putative [Rhizoctonia solani AG-3 Rhs1AP]KEP54668.1 putative histone deacetylase complex, SIN3 component [Rhizoctonia solani 123E]